MKRPGFAVHLRPHALMLGFMLFGSTFLIPAYAQGLMGYRAVDAGMALTPGGLVTIALLPFVGRMVNKVDLRILTAIGLTIGGFSLLTMTDLYLGVSFSHLVMLRILQALALPFLFVPINALAFRDIPPDKTNNASALINLARNFPWRQHRHRLRFDGADTTRAVSSESAGRTGAGAQSGLPRLRSSSRQFPRKRTGLDDNARRHLSARSSSRRRYCPIWMASGSSGILFLAMLPLLLFIRAGKGGGGAAAAAH